MAAIVITDQDTHLEFTFNSEMENYDIKDLFIPKAAITITLTPPVEGNDGSILLNYQGMKIPLFSGVVSIPSYESNQELYDGLMTMIKPVR